MHLTTTTIANHPFLTVQEWTTRGILHGFGGSSLNARDNTAISDWSSTLDRNLSLLRQEHGDAIIERGSSQHDRPAGDAWILSGSSPSLFGILTADCFPLLFCTKDLSATAAVHAGWRGVCNGIIGKTLRKITALGISPHDIEVAIGPGAQSCCYEIGADVEAELHRAADEKSVVLREGKRFADLRAAALYQLSAEGVPARNLIASSFCTICSPGYFSYRRQKDQAGRQVSFVSNRIE